MEKLNLKFNALAVDEIEQARKLPIENCIADSSVSSLVVFIQKGLIDDNGRQGVSRAVALDMLDKYLADHDKNELVLDIMEALVNAGFLSRELNIEEMRKTMKKSIAQSVSEIKK